MSSKERYLKMYEKMYLTRRFDQLLQVLFQEGHLPGFIHLCTGQEAATAGAIFDTREDDYIFMHHRGCGYSISRGMDIDKIAAEFCGKATGYSKGKGGFHQADPAKGVLGLGGSLGSNFPLSVGAGLTAQIRGKRQVVLSFFGDGSANRETAGSSMNLASVWKSPVVFICENNRWAISVPYEKSTATPHIADRAAGYGMPGITVDGNDILAVNEAVNAAIERARRGDGPSLVELMLYRWEPHAQGYPYFGADAYLEEAHANDPLKKFMVILEKEASKKEIAAVEAGVEEQIKKAYDFAVNSPRPEPEDALGDLYVGREA